MPPDGGKREGLLRALRAQHSPTKATPLSLTRETRDNEIRVLSLTGARLNVEHTPVEISLLLQKVEQPPGREKDRRNGWEGERERNGSRRDRVPDIVRYNENMAATWKSSMALLWREVEPKYL